MHHVSLRLEYIIVIITNLHVFFNTKKIKMIYCLANPYRRHLDAFDKKHYLRSLFGMRGSRVKLTGY